MSYFSINDLQNISWFPLLKSPNKNISEDQKNLKSKWPFESSEGNFKWLSGTNNANSKWPVKEATNLDTFKKSVKNKACDILDKSNHIIDATKLKYKDLNSPEYDFLKKVIKKDKELKKAENEAYQDMLEKRERYNKIKMGASMWSKEAQMLSKMGPDYEKKCQSEYKKAKQKYNNYQEARQLLKSSYPELTVLENSKIDANSSNKEIYHQMTKEFDKIQSDITEAKEKIKNNDVPMETLTNVLDEVKKDPKFAGIKDEINEWIEGEENKDKLIKWGTTGIAVVATLLTLKMGGWGGAIVGAIGTGAGIGGSIYNFERSLDLYDVSQSQQIGGKLSETSLAEAKYDAIMAGVDLALGGFDAVSAIKAVKSINKVDDATGITKKIDDIGKNDNIVPKTTPNKKIDPGGQSDKYGKFKDKADVPAKYSKDKRFDRLSSDPDQGGKISSKTRQEAMAGLEAESQGLLKKPIERGPKGIEFYDGDGIPYDVKAPPSPPENARWPFNAKDSGNSIVKELRKPDYPNKITGELEKRKVILDSTYMNKADHKALWDHIKKNATKEEVSRIIEITTDV
jgi:hypothetical protein